MRAAFLAAGSIALIGSTLISSAGAWQRPQETPSWAPKYEPAKYPPGHKPHTKLKDLLAKHKGKSSWREPIVHDDLLQSDYIMAPPGTKVSRRFHPDTREWWVVMDGEIRFDIEGQDSFVAKKGSMVQVPAQTIYSMEVIGDKPALRFETNIAKAKTLYPRDNKPPETPEVKWIPVVLGRKPFPYGYDNKPHINLYELQKASTNRRVGNRFVHDDRAVANIISGYASDLPPLNEKDRGHYHPDSCEYWLIMQGQVRYPIESVGVVIAEEGDVVYVPPFTFHAPRWWGEGWSTRLAMNGYPNISHLRDAPAH
jgi:mannose-6-phosphate isomerase-like protein (cupin superfamily)